MYVKTVSAHYVRKFNLGDYQSAEIGVTVWADLDPEEDAEQCLAACFELCKRQTKAQVLPLVHKRVGASVEVKEGVVGQLENVEANVNGNGHSTEEVA